MGDPLGEVRARSEVEAARRSQDELATLVEIGREVLKAQLDTGALCSLIYRLAGEIVPTDDFQLGLFEGDTYHIMVWAKDGALQRPVDFQVPEGRGIYGWMRRAKQPLLVHDFLTEMDTLPARPSYANDRPPRSAIYLPLLIGESVIGAMSIQSRTPDAFDESHLRLLSVLANQSASALNNANLYANSQRRLNNLTAISEVGRKITSILDLDQLLTQVVDLIQSRLGYYHVQIYLIEEGSDTARFKASSGQRFNEKWHQQGRSMRIGVEGIVGWVAQHAETLLVGDVSADPRYIPDDPRLLPDTRAELAVPLVIDGQVVGVLDVQSNEVGKLGQNDEYVLEMLADQVAVAVKSARAFEQQREEAWVTNVLLQVAGVTSQADGMEAVLEVAVRVTGMLAGVETCAIWLWDSESQVFVFGADFGLSSRLEGAPEELLRFNETDWPALDRVRYEREPIDLSVSAGDVPSILADALDGQRLIMLPMVTKGQVFGVMGASLREGEVQALEARKLAMLSGIAQQVATAVDNSRLTAAYEEEAWISTVLLQVAEAIRRLQPVDTTLDQVARLAAVLAGVDRCAVLLCGEDGAYRVRTVHALRAGLAEAYLDKVIRPAELPLLDEACRLGQPLVVDDVNDNPKVPKAWRDKYGTKSLIVVPLLVADEPIGALLADDVNTTHMFSPRRVRILAGIANQTAVALENARLQIQESQRARLGRELELAHDIQLSILPQEAPTIEGYQIAYRWQSASEVGGDFFDFIELSGDQLGMVIADVSDKGVPAALYMMFARTLLRSAAFNRREPAAALTRANARVVSDSNSDMFVTAYYSVLDVRAHVLTYASAGHNLAYYKPAARCEAEPLITDGIALGVIADAEFQQKTLRLQPGDVVLFYTDGVNEAMNADGESFGEERLVETLCRTADQPASAIAEAIQEAVRTFAGDTPQFDDLTLLLLKREG